MCGYKHVYCSVKVYILCQLVASFLFYVKNLVFWVAYNCVVLFIDHLTNLWLHKISCLQKSHKAWISCRQIVSAQWKKTIKSCLFCMEVALCNFYHLFGVKKFKGGSDQYLFNCCYFCNWYTYMEIKTHKLNKLSIINVTSVVYCLPERPWNFLFF